MTASSRGGRRSASLGMYDLAWLRTANNQLWTALRDRLRAAGETMVPDALDRSRAIDEIWRDPDVLLAQTCGLPLVTSLRNVVRVIGTPCYDFPGCSGPFYCSFVVVATGNPAAGIGDLRGERAAINGWDSQSGMSALRSVVAPFAEAGRFFSDVVVTGAHRASLAAVASGMADVAAIDCVTYGLLAAHDPAEIAGTRILCETPLVPGLPMVTAAETSDVTMNRLQDALGSVIVDPAFGDICMALGLHGFARLTEGDYAPILAHDATAAALRYPRLC